jgi:MFS family permease
VKNDNTDSSRSGGERGIFARLHHNIYGLALLSCFNQLGATFVYVTGIVYLARIFSPRSLLLMRMFTEAVPYVFTPLFGLASDYLRDRKLILWIGYGSMFFIKIGYLFCSFFQWLPPWITPYIPILFVVLKCIDRMMDGGRDSAVQALMAGSLSKKDLKTGFAIRKAIASTGSILGGLGAYFLVKFGWSQWQVYALALLPVFLSYGFLLWMVRDVTKKSPNQEKPLKTIEKSSQNFFSKIFNFGNDIYNNLLVGFLLYKLSCMNLPLYFKIPIFGFICAYEHIARWISIPGAVVLSALTLFINKSNLPGNSLYIVAGIYGLCHLLQLKYDRIARFILLFFDSYLIIKGMPIRAPNSLKIGMLLSSAVGMCINSIKRFSPSSVLTLATPLMSFKLLQLLGLPMNYYPICIFAWLWRFIDNRFPQHMKKFTKMIYGLFGFLGIYKLLSFYPGLNIWIRCAIFVGYGLLMALRRSSCEFFFAYPLAICFTAFLKTYGIVGFFQSSSASILAINSLVYMLNRIFYREDFSLFNLLRQGTGSLLLYNSFLAPLHVILNAVSDKIAGRNLITLRNFLHSISLIVGYLVISLNRYGINVYSRMIIFGAFLVVWLVKTLKIQLPKPFLSSNWKRDLLSCFVLGVSAIILTKNLFVGCAVGLFLFPLLDFFFDSNIGKKIQNTNLNRYYLVLLLSSCVGMGIVNKTIFLNFAALLKANALAGGGTPTAAMIRTGKISTILMFTVLYIAVSGYSAIVPTFNRYPILQALIFFLSLMTAHALPLIFKTSLAAWIAVIFLAISIASFNMIFSSMIGNSVEDDSIKATLFSIYNTIRGIVKIAIAIWINQWILTGAIGEKIVLTGYLSVFKHTLFIQIATLVLFIIAIPWLYYQSKE